MNHSYFASLLENYRKRTNMDTSVLSIRKALYNSYKDESFKLKERQRHAMAKQRRDEMETNRVFRNRLKEIKEKEREINKRYEQMRTKPSRVMGNETWRYTAAAKENSTHHGQQMLFFPPINASGLGEEYATELYQSEYHLSRDLRPFYNKPRLLAETMISGQDRDGGSLQHNKSKMPLTPELNSNFTDNLINHYKRPAGLRGIENSQAQGKKTKICTLTFGEQSRHIERRGPFNISSPEYDILVVDHGNDDYFS